jgi:pimeloyl-ACP methyl ester carboxylesterase
LNTLKKILLAATAALLLVQPVMAHDDDDEDTTSPPYFVDETKLPFTALPGLPAHQHWGVKGGAGYRIEVPHNWNGKLVMWAHGFRGTGLELTVDDHPLRPFLISQGWAWAASSYSRNDYDPGIGAKDTHALLRRFHRLVGHPSHVYITGASMGGHVTTVMAEKWPESYVGAMPICGVMGDFELFDYFYDFNAAAQTLSGVSKSFPYGADYLTTTVPATKAALGVPGSPAPFPFVLNENGQNFKSLVQLRSGGVRPLFEQGWLFWNAVAGDFLFGLGVGDGTLTRGRGFVLDNANIVYQFDTNRALSGAETVFNNTVQRVHPERGARRGGLRFVPTTPGDLRIPMLTLHTLGDLFVPFHMQQVYARRVAAAGNSHNLVQRATRDYGHCTFTGPELVQTFTDLVKWVEGGVKPAGDKVLSAREVAKPDFGCKFTDKVSPRQWDTTPQLAFLKPPACPAN